MQNTFPLGSMSSIENGSHSRVLFPRVTKETIWPWIWLMPLTINWGIFAVRCEKTDVAMDCYLQLSKVKLSGN